MWEFFAERVELQKWTEEEPLAELGLEATAETEPAPETPAAPAS
jgi:hypothetical protein